MIMTVVVILLVLADAFFVWYNLSALQSPITFAAPGTAGTISHIVLLGLVAAGFVLLWLAGLVDRSVLEQRIRQRDATLHAMGEELLRMKSTAYDQERPPLADVRARLEAMERDIQTIRVRLDEATTKDRPATGLATGERRV
jgi:hypothetical protein